VSGTAEAEPAPRDRELPGRNGTRAAGGLVGSSPPMPPPGLVSRPRLLAQMRAGTQGLVTLVSAPAGAGKTTLAAEWAAAADLSTVGWVAVEHEPDAHDAFWACVPTALGRCGVNLSTLGAGRPGDERVLLPGIVAPLTGRHEPVVLIVDCDEQTSSTSC
jgi:LuxR family maltose regulon positive regulatory protein